jgi:NAD(P)-dependent dehydrogenase (short-subunit alcohol dehydrogenase family)
MEKFQNISTNKVALVTGSTRGIGLSVSKRLQSLGYSVIMNGVSSNTIPEIKLEKNEQIRYIQADISKKEDRVNIIKFIKENYTRLDLLVNNAGVAPLERTDILSATEESYDRVMNINLKGPYFLTQSIANFMVESKLNKKNPDYFPIIINISSISAYVSSIFRGDYCISKAGMSMMTKLYADRLSEYGILVYEIRPGIIETDMTHKVKELYDKKINEGLLPIKRWGQPEDVADVVQAIVEGRFSYSTGQIFDVDGGFHLRKL